MFKAFTQMVGAVVDCILLTPIIEDVITPNKDAVRRENIIREILAMQDEAIATADARLDMDRYLTLTNRLVALS